MKYDLIIKNATFITPAGRVKGSLAVKDGRIAEIAQGALSKEAETERVYDADGLTVIPGLVDMHVHINDPGRTMWEDFPHATAAAAAGGITTAADMPLNSFPAVTDVKTLKGKEEAAKGRLYIDCVPWGGLTNENAGEIPSMQEAGVRAFKAFMSGSGIPDFSSAGNEALLAGLEKTVGTDSFIGVHAECDSIANYLAGKLKAKGRTDARAWALSRPLSCEMEAIGRFLNLVAASGGNGHVCHVTTAEGARLINEAMQRGLPVTFETCASYLTFTEDDLAKRGAILKCAPPLRSAENREELWSLIKDGTIPIVTSDHSPCTWELKDKESIWDAWGGISGIQTTLYTMLTEGCYKRGLSLEKLVEVCCTNPAKRLGLEGKKGVIAAGADADFAVIDPDKEWVLKEEDLLTKNRISPLIGSTIHGRVISTFLRGKEICADGKIIGEATGRFALQAI